MDHFAFNCDFYSCLCSIETNFNYRNTGWNNDSFGIQSEQVKYFLWFNLLDASHFCRLPYI